MRALQMLQRSYENDGLRFYFHLHFNKLHLLPASAPACINNFLCFQSGTVSYIAEVKLSEIECNCSVSMYTCSPRKNRRFLH